MPNRDTRNASNPDGRNNATRGGERRRAGGLSESRQRRRRCPRQDRP